MLKFCAAVGVCPAPLTWRSHVPRETINGSRQGLFAKLSPLKIETFLRPAWRSRGTGGYSNAGVTFGALAGLARQRTNPLVKAPHCFDRVDRKILIS